ncbi:acid-sensing ion channel 1 [Nephila pilipes]|uniref:Acid-sensing ion channel 1 n=1 Tax=Nephila pilipes TaxID=299642 RepID=A0A8X6QNJ4_NEPPI|nr:acid-sensing ion channel 1 [Nephila pilipes]
MTDSIKVESEISKPDNLRTFEELDVDQSFYERDVNDKIHVLPLDEILKNSAIFLISKIGRTESKFRRILWLLVLVTSVLGCGFQINRFLHLYFQYPVLVNLEVERKMSLDFPAVTICSFNDIKKHNEDCSVRKSLTKILFTEYYPTLTNNSITDTNSTNKSNKSDGDIQQSGDFIKYNESTKDHREEHSESFIVNCFFNGDDCPADYFDHFESSRYGNCFTFNKGANIEDKPLSVTKSGLYTGLEIVLDTEHGNYSCPSGAIGFRIVIHDPSETPNTNEKGFNISPGLETSVSMRQTLIHRLPPPYKDRCAYYNTGKRSNQTNQNDCQRLCFQKRSFEMCGCIDSRLDAEENVMSCDMTNKSESRCLNDVLEFISTHGTVCDCPLPCISKVYNEVLSQAMWSVNGLQANEYSGSPSQSKSEFQERYAKLKVFYSTLEKSIFMQKPMFEDSELFSHLGGELGLWLGLSLIALFELIWNIIHVVKFFVRSCLKY